MSHAPIKSIKNGDQLKSIYYLDKLDTKKTNAGKDFALITIRDSTGSLNGVMWDRVEPILDGTVRTESFAEITGRVGQYRNQLQLVVESIKPIHPDKVDKSCFMPVGPIPAETLLAELDKIIASVEDRDYKMLLVAIFQDDEALRDQFAKAPSALKMHQAYIGGLLEHTLQVLNVAQSIAKNYPGFDKDLLVAATLLHDIGKIREFDYEVVIRYTDSGRLIGHIVIGIELVHEKIRKIGGFPPQKEMLLTHTILAHHGEREWGSPKRPKTLEALILHFADLIDSRLSTFMDHKKIGEEQGRAWSDYLPIFERAMYLGYTTPVESEDQEGV